MGKLRQQYGPQGIARFRDVARVAIGVQGPLEGAASGAARV